jgi:hypothetical protein
VYEEIQFLHSSFRLSRLRRLQRSKFHFILA